jgi:hypothetical protein
MPLSTHFEPRGAFGRGRALPYVVDHATEEANDEKHGANNDENDGDYDNHGDNRYIFDRLRKFGV